MEILNELTLSNFLLKQEHNSFGIITAFRSNRRIKDSNGNIKIINNDREYNLERNAKLKEDLRSRGFDTDYVLKGVYKENYRTKNEREVKEDAFLIFSYGSQYGKPNVSLEKTLKKLGEKYNQDSVLYKPQDKDIVYLIGTSNIPDDDGNTPFPDGVYYNLGKFRPKFIGEFYSRMRGIPFAVTMNNDLNFGKYDNKYNKDEQNKLNNFYSNQLDKERLKDFKNDRQDLMTGTTVLESLTIIRNKSIDHRKELILCQFIIEKNIFQKTLDILRG